MPVAPIVPVLAATVALVMTGSGVVLPVFARRVDALGGDASILALMTAAFALGHALCAPLAGWAADRWGRRPFIWLSTIGFVLANLGYLWASSTSSLIVVRGLAGVLTAGLYPATLGIVDDLAEPDRRGRHMGLIMAGYGAGLVLGPVLGGLLYDVGGFAAPFQCSAAAGAIAALLSFVWLPETRRGTVQAKPLSDEQANAPSTLAIAALLALDFAATFAFGFAEPRMIFHVYEALHWTSTQLGITLGAYGLAMVVGQVACGGWSDRLGRTKVLFGGLALSLSLYVGLATLSSFGGLFWSALIAGLGVSLVGPALAALYLDLSPERSRSRLMGLKSAATALGSVCGPLALSLVAQSWSARSVFWGAAALLVAVGLSVLATLTHKRLGGRVSERALEAPALAATAANVRER